ncbi:MAG: HEAT repeat domain-containing protein [Leptolyngbyaceae cyanobacterium]
MHGLPILIVLVLGMMVSLIRYVYDRSRFELGPGRTPAETAQILVHDWKCGRRAQKKAIQDGDHLLGFLRQETRNFDFASCMETQILLLAEVLSAIQTEQSREILTELFHRTDIWSRLVGAAGLAQQGVFPDVIDEQAWLVQQVRQQPNNHKTILAIRALGFTQQQAAVPCLLDHLKHYGPQPDVCTALARLRSPEAIPVLKDCFNKANALLFRALITLGDRNAVPMAIAQINRQHHQSQTMKRLITELQWVTGQSYHYNQAKWQRWWQSVEETWQVPEAFQHPWDDQRHSEYKVELSQLTAFLLSLLAILFNGLVKIISVFRR